MPEPRAREDLDFNSSSSTTYKEKNQPNQTATSHTQDPRERAKALLASGLILDDWRITFLATVVTQPREASGSQIAKLQEIEAMAALIAEAKAKSAAAQEPRRTTPPERGYWSREAMQERLTAYQRVRAEQGPSEDLDGRISALRARLGRCE